MSNPTVILGWDVGGTKSAAVVGTADGRVLARQEWASRVEIGPDRMIARFLEAARGLLARFAGVRAVGVSIGGPMDPLAGVIQSPPHLPGWDGVPLKETLERELGLAAVVEHDAAACLLAEWLWGAARGATHAAYLTCGTGCGAGVLIDGRVLRGPGGRTAELGHVRLADDGPEMFAKRGCVESFCSGEGIARLAPFMFPGRFPGPVPPAELVRRRDGGDEAAAAVLAEAARRLGQACAVLADLFGPQVIVLGTLARHFGSGWVEQVREAFAREALPANVADARIVPAALDNLQDLSPIAAWVCRQSARSPAVA